RGGMAFYFTEWLTHGRCRLLTERDGVLFHGMAYSRMKRWTAFPVRSLYQVGKAVFFKECKSPLPLTRNTFFLTCLYEKIRALEVWLQKALILTDTFFT